MTLDEQIAWLECLAAEALIDARASEAEAAEWHSYVAEAYKRYGDGYIDDATKYRERAATLLTIQNTLREYQRSIRPKLRNGDRIVVLRRPARRPKKGEQAETVSATYIKRDRASGAVLVEIDGAICRVKHANVRREAA